MSIFPADPPAPQAAEEVTLAQRQCGRCRQLFDGDPTLLPTAMPEWWACEPCRAALLGR